MKLGNGITGIQIQKTKINDICIDYLFFNRNRMGRDK